METSSLTLSRCLDKIVSTPEVHARWINTLSMMESIGSKKIYQFQDRILTSITILKHSAEEARHAYYLKKQIRKVGDIYLKDYRPEYLLAAHKSYRYLDKLDIFTCQYLKHHLDLDRVQIKYVSYLLVTYVIELRADILYNAYQQELSLIGSNVNVKSIIAEEEGHLIEMERMLESYSYRWKEMAELIRSKEVTLFEEWMKAVERDLNLIYNLSQ